MPDRRSELLVESTLGHLAAPWGDFYPSGRVKGRPPRSRVCNRLQLLLC